MRSLSFVTVLALLAIAFTGCPPERPVPDPDEEVDAERDETAEKPDDEAGGEVAEPVAGGDEAGTAEPAAEDQREAMKKFLGLYLERRRILKNRGRTPDRKFLVMEHTKSRNVFLVPAGNLEPYEILKIGEESERRQRLRPTSAMPDCRNRRAAALRQIKAHAAATP
jgi:predicted small lipoprotein YifL